MQSGKIAHAVIRIIKLVINYFLEKMASSANRKVSLKVMLGLSHHSIQMGQSGFNIEQNQNTLTLGESHLFSTIKLNKVIKVISYMLCSSRIQHLCLNTTARDFSVHHTHHGKMTWMIFYLTKVSSLQSP
jgi:hypothetical protein